MTKLDFEPLTVTVPLREDPSGVLRVGNSRVLLELVLRAFKAGATPEAIVQSYDTLKLADVYAVVSRYLSAPNPFEEYLHAREEAGAETRRPKALRATYAPSCWPAQRPRRRRVLKLASDENFDGVVIAENCGNGCG